MRQIVRAESKGRGEAPGLREPREAPSRIRQGGGPWNSHDAYHIYIASSFPPSVRYRGGEHHHPSQELFKFVAAIVLTETHIL